MFEKDGWVSVEAGGGQYFDEPKMYGKVINVLNKMTQVEYFGGPHNGKQCYVLNELLTEEPQFDPLNYQEEQPMEVVLKGVYHGKNSRSKFIYASLYAKKDGHLVIAATLEYVLKEIEDNGYVLVKD